ncbi:putative BPI/LBP family protein [Drosera capensis]
MRANSQQLGIQNKSMEASILLIFFIFSKFCILGHTQLNSSEDGYISVSISEKGLVFVKDLLIDKAVSALTPLELPDIVKNVKIPVVGKVHIVLSDVVIYHIDVESSYVESGEDGFVIAASGATGNMSMSWKYSYKPWLVPIEVSDKGDASVLVEGMEVALLASLRSNEGKLKLSVLECGCSVEDITIKLDGGASWLYQGLVEAFGNKIESAVENAITKKINQGISKIDSSLQSLPQDIRVDDTASLNVTFVSDPTFDDSYVDFEINGLFIGTENALPPKHQNGISQALASCQGPAKMVAISLQADVLNSASLVYFRAGEMQWTLAKIPDQSILNTADWREDVPQLYEQFPDDDMTLNVSVSSSPVLKVSSDTMDTIIYSDVTIDVLDDSVATSVACISLVITASGSVEMSGNNLTGSIKLDNISLSSKWSSVGDLPLHLIEPVIASVFDGYLMPRLNSHLKHGFPMPVIHGIELQNPDIFLSESRITVCSDAEFSENDSFFELPHFLEFASILKNFPWTQPQIT